MTRRFATDRSGATAVEFALVLPVFATMLLGIFAVSSLAFAANSLHFAVEEAARRAAVKTTVCGDAAATRAYAATRYVGPRITPVFTYSQTACGHTVTASATFDLDLVPELANVPLSATACYPA